ncbi:nuclear transport factor 2 family protein [Micromonospora krabiensis]|uniref:SnoaL-like domain-containing protein n=1 Tax=Micromonospora krabiensis TaxID=307121 RepID=A0A1C3MXF8_9ACTN|nr:nuclear transport factor 2 family protein [Micromonospora krabiensis]SBV25013.1 SnoaL-like domain-containing protein [Micromonospora krabiensis]
MDKQETRKATTMRARVTGAAAAAALLIGGGVGAASLLSAPANAHGHGQTVSASSKSLGERVQRLEDIEEIHQLKARYFRFVDEKKHDELAALFTRDAKLETDGITWKSPQEFAHTIRDLTGAAPSAHSGAMPEITITGPNTASGIWSMEDILTFPAGPNAPEGHNGYGQYRETYKKVNGKWLIDSVVLTRFWMDPLPAWTPPATTGPSSTTTPPATTNGK